MANKRKAPESRKLTDFFAHPGESSTTSTENDSIEDDAMVVAKHTNHRCTFNPEWNDEFQWLLLKPDEGMYCTLCQKHNKSTKRKVFITTPCVLYRKDKLHEHQKSRGHADAVFAESHAVASKSSDGIRTAIDRLHRSNEVLVLVSQGGNSPPH